MSVVIERATAEDAVAMLEYLKQIGGETDNLTFGPEGMPFTPEAEAAYIAQIEYSPDNIMLVAKAEGKIIGDASLNRLPRRMSHRGDLGVSVIKEYWNKGIGSQLLSKVLAWAKENNFEVIDLQVRSDNLQAIHLYEKFGFRKIGTHSAFFKINNEYIAFDYMSLMLEKRKSIFKSTLNTRQILKDSLRFIRSDVPVQVSEEERTWLLANDITTIIDLRTEEERLRKECPLAKDERFQYYCMPVTGGNAVPQTVQDVSKSYINMVDAQLYQTIEFICNAKSNVLYFCNAGKDRTGVVSAILLYRAGMSLDYIVEDYMKSAINLKSMLETYAKQNPEIDVNVITPQERYMKEFLEWFCNEKSPFAGE